MRRHFALEAIDHFGCLQPFELNVPGTANENADSSHGVCLFLDEKQPGFKLEIVGASPTGGQNARNQTGKLRLLSNQPPNASTFAELLVHWAPFFTL
jgi:hypothetical protein